MNRSKNSKNTYCLFFSCIFCCATGLSQNAIKLKYECRGWGKITHTLKNKRGVLMLGKPNFILYTSSKAQFKVIPCNLPNIKSIDKPIKISFSGGIREVHEAMKVIAPTIVLTKLIIYK
jgi:hypothetical protein